MTESPTLRFFYQGKTLRPVLDPDESDLIPNAIVLEQLVGTLIKERHGNTGRSEPYLAERWQVSPDGLVWDFYLRPNIKTEDGTLIHAESFKASLLSRFRANAKRHDLPAFNLLVGWKKFVTGQSEDLPGVEALSSLHLRLTFSAKPNGILEYLAMPTYGFFSDANYRDGKWKDKYAFSASGPYQLVKNDPNGTVDMALRVDWPLAPKGAPQKLRFHYGPLDEFLREKPTNALVLVRNTSQLDTIDGFVRITGAPILLTSIILSPERNHLFHDPSNREIFRAQLRALQMEIPYTGKDVVFGEDFYPTAPAKRGAISNDPFSRTLKAMSPSKTVLIHGQTNSTSPAYQHLMSLVKEVLRRNGLQSEIVGSDLSDPKWLQGRNDRASYDIRLGTVDIGGNLENWVVKMIFCSEFGVQFPDPSGRLCRLTSQVESNPAALTDQAYAEEFNRILNEDCAVIPGFHFGLTWLAGTQLDLTHMSPNMMVPRLELFSIR